MKTMTEKEYDMVFERLYGPMPKKRSKVKLFLEVTFVVLCAVAGWAIK